MNFFWGMGTYGMARSASHDAASASASARRASTDVQMLEDRLERAMLACEAMWMLLRDKTGATDQELADRITDLDLSDGVLDGKVRKSTQACAKCGRALSPRFAKCMYCGQLVARDPFS